MRTYPREYTPTDIRKQLTVDNGLVASGMVKALSYLKMEQGIVVSGNLVLLMVLGDSRCKMEQSMKANFRLGDGTARASR